VVLKAREEGAGRRRRAGGRLCCNAGRAYNSQNEWIGAYPKHLSPHSIVLGAEPIGGSRGHD
jgi:hypothetical protein